MLRRIGNSSIATLSSQVISIASNLLLVPLFLLAWTPQVYGEWVTLTALVAYLSTIDMGVGLYGVNKLTQAYARNDLQEYRRYQSTFLTFYCVSALVGSVLIILVAWSLPFAAWLDIQETPSAQIPFVIVLLGIQVLWNVPQGLIISIYRTTGNLAKTQWIINVQRLLVLGVVTWGLIVGVNMVQLAFLQLTPMILITSATLWDVYRRQPMLFPVFPGADWNTFLMTLKPSLLFAVFVLTTPLVVQGTVLLVSAILGTLAVVVFTTTRTLINMVRQVIAAISYAIWPELTIIESRGEVTKLVRATYLTVTLTMVLGFSFGSALWFEGASVIQSWTRHQVQPDVMLLRMFLVQTTFSVIVASVGLSAVATNRHRTNSLAALAGSVAGLVFAAVLIRPMGVVGVPLGLLAGEAIFIYHFVVKDACQHLRLNYFSFSAYLWIGILTIGFGSLSAGWFSHQLFLKDSIQDFLRWTVVGISTSATAFLLGTMVFFIQQRLSRLPRQNVVMLN